MNRKKGWAVLALVVLLGLAAALPLQGATPVKMIFNGSELKYEVAPVIIDGRTMVPLRVIAESLGAKVDWDGDKQIVYIEKQVEEANERHCVKINGEPTTWPYWIRNGKMYMEYRNAVQLVCEANKAPLHAVNFFTHNNTLYVDNVRYPLTMNEEDGYKIVSIDYLRDLGVVNFNWDEENENLELISR